MTTVTAPHETPAYGRRLLPMLIDERARQDWKRPWASIPISNDLSQGFRDISYRQYANAIDRCAHWIRDNIGTSTTFEPLVYFPGAHLDIRYQILVMAAVKTGHIMFFVSPRNSIDAHVSLLQESKAIKIIVPKVEPAALSTLLERQNIDKITIPDLSYFLDDKPVDPIGLEGTFESWRGKPFLMLHTSGSTGLPKVILIKHGYFETCDAFHLRPGGHAIGQRAGGMRVFVPFPAFHITGLSWSIAISIFVDSTMVLPPPVPVTADLVARIHKIGDVGYSCLQPSIIVDMTKSEGQLETLKLLKGLSFVGGPLPQATGDLVSKMTHLHTSMGSTEAFTFPQLPKEVSEWQWFHFDEEGCGFEFRETDGSGLHEMVIVKDEKKSLLQAIFVTFPDITEYHTKDLYTQHPEKRHLWKYAGRLDDIIVFSNGEKLNPVTMEGTIATCPIVSGCLVVGQGRFQAALLVEATVPSRDSAERLQLLKTVWPYVEKANQSCVTHGRIAEDMVIFTSPEKPLARAGKGTVIRGQCNKLYAEEIERLYGHGSVRETAVDHLDLESIQAAETSLKHFLERVLGISDIGMDDDILSLGIDSLQLINLTRTINNSLKGYHIEPKQIYDNPTIRQLASSLHNLGNFLVDSDSEDEESWNQMEKTFQDVLQTLPGYSPPKKRRWMTARSTPAWQPPPDGGTIAWLQVLGSFLVNMNNWGLINSFGVFQAFYQEQYLPDKSVDSISWIGTLQGALCLIVGVVSGPIFDMGHMRILLVAAGLTLVFSLMMLSLSTQYYQIMLCQGLLLGISSGFLYIPSVALIPLYFNKKRGLALGIATAGGSFGGVIYPIIFQRLLTSLGFPWATRVIAFVALITLASATALTRPFGPSKRPIRELLDISGFRQLSFIAFMVMAFLFYAGILVPFFLGTTFATSIGSSTNMAFYVQCILNASQFFGRIIAGFLSDKIGSRSFGSETILSAAQFSLAIMGFCWIAVHSVAGFVVFAVFYGFLTGFITTLPAVIVPYLVPSLAVLGTRIGMLYGAAGIGFLISTPIASAAAESTDDFLGAQTWAGTTMMVGACVFLPLTLPEVRRRRLTAERGRKSRQES